MSKVTYLIKRITKMNFSNMFKTIDLVHNKTNKNKLYIFFDIINCGLKYQAGYVDYNLFEMYNMNSKERKTVITRGINNRIIKTFNDMSLAYKFENKAIFNELFNKYLNREWICLNNASLDDFKKYLKGKKEVIVKPLDQACGKGIEKINIEKESAENLYNHLKETKQVLVEDVATQHKVLNDIYPYSINTLRIITLNHQVVAAYLRIGNHGNVVDNFNHGGMAACINKDTGIIQYKAIDKTSAVYDVHPMTNKKFVGVQIPMWDKIIKLVTDASHVVPELGYVGWDVCVGEKEPCLIEGNDFPGHDIYQLPVHREGNMGLLPVFESAMKGVKLK